MAPKDSGTDLDCLEIAETWLSAFATAFANGDTKALRGALADQSHWRDILAFTWNIETTSGSDEIAATLLRLAEQRKPANFRVPSERTRPREVTRAGTACIEIIIAFDTNVGPCDGIIRLVEDGGAYKAWTMSTALEAIAGHEERLSEARAGGDAHNRDWGGENWQDLRNKARAFEDRDPAVLIVGGGQAGLDAAARLTHLGVDTLIVDRYERVGDNWRTRYHSLTLHNEVYVNHMPYMPFPPTWPVYIPKDMLANWFEHYVEALELNYWTGTSMTRGSYDENSGTWDITLEKSDGSVRVIRPRHLIMATGVSAIPIMPDLPGLDTFSGTVMHSGHYTDGKAWKGKTAYVIGTGNSAHDVAQDLCAAGANVTMIQRASSHIVSLAEAQRVYAIYAEGPPIDDCDLLATSFPFPVLKKGYQLATEASKEIDKEMLDGLAARGFKLNDGVDDCGFQMSYLQRGGGYYFNVGCSDLIIDGSIKLMHWDDIETFAPEGIQMKDGASKPADLIVLATGYKNQQETARAYLGDDIAERVGPVWGFSDRGELRNMWCRTAQPGLWFTAGSLAQCRIFSRFLALQIKACEEGLLSARLND